MIYSFQILIKIPEQNPTFREVFSICFSTIFENGLNSQFMFDLA